MSEIAANTPYLAWLAPLFLMGEGVQLVLSERLLGVKQIALGGDPRERGPSATRAALWTIGLVLYWGWMGAMLVPNFARAQVICLLVVSFIGYALRRNCGLKWVLVILTLEGAVRIGMLLSLTVKAIGGR